MTNVGTELHDAIQAKNYSASSTLLNKIIEDNLVDKVAVQFGEQDTQDSHPTLEFRDHALYFMGLWELYFAIEIPSIELLVDIQERRNENDTEIVSIELIREWIEDNDARLNQSFIDLEAISRTRFAVLLPQILTQRSEELENCVIPFRTTPNEQYCIVNLLKTYYGKKIATAALSDSNIDTVVGKKTFGKLYRNLESAGLNVGLMLEEYDSVKWNEIICNITEQHESNIKSRELRLLHRVRTARFEIFLSSFRKQVAALDTILNSKTQVCNDVLMRIASDVTNPMRRRAINALGTTGDSTTMEFLSRFMNDRDDGVKVEATRAFSLLASQSKWSGIQHKITPISQKVPLLDIAKINQVLNTLIAKNMPPALVDDTLTAVALQGNQYAIDILERLLNKPQSQIRMAVVRSTRRLEKDAAARIIKAALDDDDPEVVRLAEKEIENRWSDDVW